MDLPDQSMHSPGEGCLKEDKSEIMVSCCHRDRMEDPLAAYPNNSIISHLLRKTIHNKRAMSGNMFYLPTSTALSGLEDQSILCSKDSVEHTELFQHHNPPIGTGMETERPLSDHLQAKRARVENIIRGMSSGSPNSRLQGDDDVAGDPDLEQERKEISKENKRKQRLPQHQEHSLSEEPSLSNRGSVSASKNQECHKLKQQLQSMQKLLQQLEEKFFQVYNQHDSQNSIAEEEEEEEEEEDSDILHPDQRRGLTRTKTGSEATDVPSAVAGGCENRPDWMTSQRREKALPDVNCLGSKGDVKNLQETLKFELSRAVNESIDTVFQKLSSTLLSQSSPPPSMCHPSTPDHAGSAKRPHMPCSPLEPSNTEDATVKPRPLQYYKSSTPQSPEHQTEALSLVVRKSPNSPLNSTSQSVKQPYAFHQPPFQFGYPTMHDSQILEHLLKYGPHGNLGGLTCLPPSLDRASPDSEDLPWESLSMRSKVMSSHLGQHSRPGILGSVSVDGLCLPHVKMECRDLQTMAERSSYISLSIQEGLTPSHLKKAKLMFFYTRYPSSSVLKTYFPDVKFNRCITSQLIKWFSNFREFYYIQMEKVARQAIVDGVNDVKGLTVTRDCELFRALNMHYNKANDFQVPDRFLEVAEITLQEFFTAILLAKDSDPSWKKAIYKVICKLDSDVPEEFKTSTYL